MTISVKFINLWPGKSAKSLVSHFFLPLLEEVFQDKIDLTSGSSKPNLAVSGNFPLSNLNRGARVRDRISNIQKNFTKSNQLKISTAIRNFEPTYSEAENAEKSIWFTGENERPPSHAFWDSFLSFETDNLMGKNNYLPIWVWNLNWFDKPRAVGFNSSYDTVETILRPRDLDGGDFSEKLFCCVFLNNLTPWRKRIIDYLSQIGKVDVYGGLFGGSIQDKNSISVNYKFILCFENDLYPGYVTEKALEGWQSKAVPLYWGMDSMGYLNSKAFIELIEVEKFLQEVNEVNSSRDKWLSIVNEPFLTRQYEISELVESLRKQLK
jgi:hypothetical protein